MKPEPLLSIIIPVYQAESYLSRCLDSIFVQTERFFGKEFPDSLPGNAANGKCKESGSVRDSGIEAVLEVIAVNDGSTDRSGVILHRYAERYAALSVCEQENRGAAGARNTGLQRARGRYVWFVDPDDYLAEHALSDVLRAVSKKKSTYTEADILLFDAYEERRGKRFRWEQSFGKEFSDDLTPDRLICQKSDLFRLQQGVLYSPDAGTKTPLSAPWDKVYRRNFLIENGLLFPDELRVLDDMFFNLCAFGAAKKVRYIKKPIYHYVRNSAGITASYTPKRWKLDEAVWAAIQSYLEENYAASSFLRLERSFQKRIVKSYAICLKLSVFHPRNPQGFREKSKEAVRLLGSSYHRKAFCMLPVFSVEWRLWPVLFIGKIIVLRQSRRTSKSPDHPKIRPADSLPGENQ